MVKREGGGIDVDNKFNHIRQTWKSHAERRVEALKKTKKDKIIQASIEILADVGQATIRQLFYQLVVRGIVENNQQQYKYVSKVLVGARLRGIVNWQRIVDGGRDPIHNSMDNTIRDYVETLPPYRQNIWKTQQNYVEVWLEKEALSRIVLDALAKWDNRITLQVMRGYTSLTSKMKAAERYAMHRKGGRYDKTIPHGGCAVALILTDFDPSGKDIARDVNDWFHNSRFRGDVFTQRIGLTRFQVDKYQLPQYPAKPTDPRYAKDEDKIQVELDALRPDVLKQLIQDEVGRYIDQLAYDRVIEEEKKTQEKIDGALGLWCGK